MVAELSLQVLPPGRVHDPDVETNAKIGFWRRFAARYTGVGTASGSPGHWRKYPVWFIASICRTAELPSRGNPSPKLRMLYFDAKICRPTKARARNDPSWCVLLHFLCRLRFLYPPQLHAGPSRQARRRSHPEPGRPSQVRLLLLRRAHGDHCWVIIALCEPDLLGGGRGACIDATIPTTACPPSS